MILEGQHEPILPTSSLYRIRIAYSLVGQDNRLSPGRPGFESLWGKGAGPARAGRLGIPSITAPVRLGLVRSGHTTDHTPGLTWCWSDHLTRSYAGSHPVRSSPRSWAGSHPVRSDHRSKGSGSKLERPRSLLVMLSRLAKSKIDFNDYP